MSKLAQFFVLSVFCFFLFASCNEKVNATKIDYKTENVVLVEAEKYLTSDSIMLGQSTEYIMSNGESSWATYEVNIKKAGRYKLILKVETGTSNAIIWVDDYIVNKDDRTYNITGNVKVAENMTFAEYSKDGSPLNKGTHQIKVHISGKGVKFDWLRFELIQPRILTPKNMMQKTDGKDWKVVWSDEFEGIGMVDTSKWTFDIGNWGWGNNELQYYTNNRLSNARQEGGNLIIEARKGDLGYEWTSTRLTTREKVSFTYGRIEFRAKVPHNKGNWAAGWTLGDAYIDEISWPYCGEIDILESVGYEMNDKTGNGIAHASVHCRAYYFKLGNQPTGIINVKNMDDDFHTYTVDWTPEKITAYVDGNEYFDYDDTSNEQTWPFDEPQNIILNLAMGGGWGGLQGMDESITSQKFIVDYVRVYSKE